MRDRMLFAGLLTLSLVLPLAGCSNSSGLDSISISPTSQSLSAAQTVQFSVTGTYGNSSHTSTKAVTSGVTWTSSNTAVATVDANGMATAVAAGSATITASAQAFNGPTSATATITVTSGSSGGTGSSGAMASITLTPSTLSVGVGGTGQFIAIGKTSSGTTVDVTSQVTWVSSLPSVATISASSGLATGLSAGATTITAIYTDSTSGTSATGTAALTVTAAATGAYTSISIIPSSQALSATGQTGQFIALGTTSSGLVEDVTDSADIQWSSSAPSIAKVDSGTGLATGVSAGTTTVTAELTNPTSSGGGIVTANATVTVSVTTAAEPILSLEIIPSSISVNDFNLSGQFIAIATYSVAPYVRDVTNNAATTWLSAVPNIFPVNNSTGGSVGASGGIVTAEGSGSATIIAEAENTGDGTIETATATFNCPHVEAVTGSSTPPSCPNTDTTGSGTILLSTLTIYQRGLNTTNWYVTAPSATGTADVLHCGPGWTLNGGTGGSVCTATYPINSTVTITAPAGAGAFGGWSSNCTATTTVTAAGPNTCQVSLTNDDVVGVIVN